MSSAADRSGRAGISRRGLIGAVGAGAAIAGVGALAGRTTAGPPDSRADVVPFRGPHQSGISTPVQDRLHFAAFDVTTESRSDVIALLAEWTAVAERLTRGAETYPGGATDGKPLAPPSDTGEALGAPASRLTLTIGFGPTLFGTPAADRFGIAHRRPAALADIPHFPNDKLDPARGGGDIAIQACADDPQVAVHAVRNLARIGVGTVAVRWSQLGFGRSSTTSTSQPTPRNLMGFKDGTNNLDVTDEAALTEHVWIDAADDQPWLAGGSYLVARRIRMLIEPWDRATLAEQERVIGRAKGSGAPLGGRHEFDTVDLAAAESTGPMIAPDAHIRLASHESLDGIRILRRGYNYTDGTDGFGHLDAGLFFIAFCRDPRRQFVPMQRALGRSDALNEYIQHVASAQFVVPPGPGTDEHWGTRLFAD